MQETDRKRAGVLALRTAIVTVVAIVATVAGTAIADADDTPDRAHSAAASDHLIAWNADGMVTRIGKITRPDRRGYTGRALRGRLGKPSSRRRTSANSCRYTWKRHSLWATLVHFGGKYVRCDRNYLQLAEIKGAGGSRWHTPDGLYFGESEDRLRAVYPNAHKLRVYRELVWVIADLATPIQPDENVPTVWAKTRNGRIVKFGIWVGGAGD